MRRVELDLLGIFFGLDFDKAFDWLFNGFGQIVQRLNFFSVHLFHGEVSKIIVADCAVRRKDQSAKLRVDPPS